MARCAETGHALFLAGAQEAQGRRHAAATASYLNTQLDADKFGFKVKDEPLCARV